MMEPIYLILPDSFKFSPIKMIGDLKVIKPVIDRIKNKHPHLRNINYSYFHCDRSDKCSIDPGGPAFIKQKTEELSVGKYSFRIGREHVHKAHRIMKNNSDEIITGYISSPQNYGFLVLPKEIHNVVMLWLYSLLNKDECLNASLLMENKREKIEKESGGKYIRAENHPRLKRKTDEK